MAVPVGAPAERAAGQRVPRRRARRGGAATTSYGGCAPWPPTSTARAATAGAGLPLELAAGEVVLWALPAAQLVEVRHTAVLPAPDLTVAPAGRALRPRRPDGVKVVDAGMAVITSRRLVLLGGRGRRDWAYGRMTGLAHDPAAPVTLIQVLDRRRTSGLLLPADAAADFRFKLTLAFADAIEQRAAVLAQLDELIAEHDQLRPFRPGGGHPRAGPAHRARAGRPADRRGGRRHRAAGAGGAASSRTRRTRRRRGGRRRRHPGAHPTRRRRADRARRPAPAHATAAEADASVHARRASRDRGPRCGAPANPLGYDFCGGTRIRRPAAEVCDWFDCVPQFWAGRGYLVQCRDGSVSLTGGRPDVCAGHDGLRRTVRR